MANNITRVLGLLNEMEIELQKISESNPELEGVLDHLLTLVKVQRQELQKKRFSYVDLSLLMKFIVNLIEIIDKWNNTLYYKFCRCKATINRGYRICQLVKALSCSGFMQT
jgi:hypothetical protein